MTTNNKEIEVKFEIKNVQDIKNKLIKIGGEIGEKVFQRTIKLDTPNEDLMKRGVFLRVRKEDYDVMTVKIKNKEDKELFERDEFEIKIENADKAAQMLKIVGFSFERILEKYRETCIFKNKSVIVVIDKLPFGDYIEIECENKKEIEDMISNLGLLSEKRIVGTYWDLLKEKEGPDKKDAIF